MRKLALRRIAAMGVTLLVIVTLSFAIIRLAPGGPFDQEQALSPAVRANLERLYGLDQPLPVQYLHYLRALAHGDFGPSLRQRDFTVRELLAQGLPLSATLGLIALVAAVLGGVSAGIAAALWRTAGADVGFATASALAIALPGFVTGPLLALVFGLHLHWLPVAGWEADAPRYLVLPVLTLALPVAAYLARLTRASLLEVLRSRFVRSARARPGRRARTVAPRAAAGTAAGGELSRPRRRLHHHRLAGGGERICSAGQRPLPGAGRDRSRLPAGHGHGGGVRGPDAAAEPRGRSRLRLARSGLTA